MKTHNFGPALFAILGLVSFFGGALLTMSNSFPFGSIFMFFGFISAIAGMVSGINHIKKYGVEGIVLVGTLISGAECLFFPYAFILGTLGV